NTQIDDAMGSDGGGFRYAQHGGPRDAQVWTTAQVLYALETADALPPNGRLAIRHGFDYIERMRVPPAKGPCQQPNGQGDGWAYIKFLRWGVTEINSWVLVSKIVSLRSPPAPTIWDDSEIPDKIADIKSDLTALARRQHQPSGGWAPIYKTTDESHLRTYST